MPDLGDPVPLSITITDASGNPANATEVNLTITLPDGSTVTQGPISPNPTGVYTYVYPTIQVGRHNARWVATGTNAATYNNAFYVNPPDTGEFISLEQFRRFIRKTHTKDDELIRTFISAACDIINDRVGQVSPRTFVEDVETVDGYARLDKWPIISITSVQTLPGLSVVAPANKATGVEGWVLGNPLYIGRSGAYRVTYRAGLLDIPQNYILAALELTRHLWQNSQQNAAGGRPGNAIEEVVAMGRFSEVTYAMPYTVRQLLGLDKRPRRGIWVG